MTLLGVGAARAQSTQDEAPVTEGVPKFRAPVLTHRAPAVYPPAALAAGLTGIVVLEFDVDEKGRVSNVVVKTPAGHGFDEAATAAVRQFEFAPAENDRAPVPSHITYAYKFVIEQKRAPVRDQTVRFRGHALLRGTRAPLVGGSVTARAGEGAEVFRSAVDEQGRFAIAGIPPGRYHVTLSGPKAKRFETDEVIGSGEALVVNYYIEPSQTARYESTVRGDLNREEISRQQLTTEELVKMPGTMGDALRAVENLPGVARAPFNSGLIIVRGGKPSDSRVFMAGAEVPQLYHFGGFTSVVPSQLIDHVDYFPGNFGVRYGRAIAGAIDVDLREGKRDRLHGAAETNLFDTGVMVEGPVGKGSFVLAARRSYVDLILSSVLPASAGLRFVTAPVYYDYQATFDYPLLGGHFRAFAFGADDQLKFAFAHPTDADPTLTGFATHILFHRLQLRWTKTTGGWQIYAQNSTGYNGTGGSVGRSIAFDVSVVESDSRLEARYNYSRHLRLLVGSDAQYAHLNLGASLPPPVREGQTPSPVSAQEKQRVDEVQDIFNIGVYLEAIWKPTARLTITPGVRFDYFGALHKMTYNPRLTARLQLGELTWLKAGVGLFSQDPQPPDYDASYGNPKVRPESAIHYALTVERALLPGLMLEATGFYKQLYDLIAVTSNYEMVSGKLTPERVANDGIGRIYGGELLLRQSLSKWFFGWVSYTLMRSERKDCQACAWRLFDFDQTHILVIALHAYLPRGFEAGVRFRYISGFPYTPPYGGFYDADADVYAPVKGRVNTGRLDAFNQLDIRFDKTFVFQRWLLKLYLDVTNVYNNPNQEQNQPSYDFQHVAPITGLPIVPSFGVRGEF